MHERAGLEVARLAGLVQPFDEAGASETRGALWKAQKPVLRTLAQRYAGLNTMGGFTQEKVNCRPVRKKCHPDGCALRRLLAQVDDLVALVGETVITPLMRRPSRPAQGVITPPPTDPIDSSLQQQIRLPHKTHGAWVLLGS
jgi:hypothetical protein